MGRRIFCTGLMLAGAAGGFLGAAPLPAGPLNLFGLVFLTLSGVIWFGWSVIPDIYAYHEERAASGRLRLDIIALRMAPVLTMRSGRDKKKASQPATDRSDRSGGTAPPRGR